MTEYTFNSAEEQGAVAGASAPPERPTVTFMGNTYDLTSLGALASGLLLMFMCLTCNLGLYCLPFIPVITGVIGLVTARQAVDSERTRLWSWLGVGMGGVVLVLAGIGVILYLVLTIVMVMTTEGMS